MYQHSPQLSNIETCDALKDSHIDGLWTRKNGLTKHHYVVSDQNDLAPVDVIMRQRIDEEVRLLEPNQKLFVFMGEDHVTPTTKLPQVGVISHLQEQYSSDFIVGIESCYGEVHQVYQKNGVLTVNAPTVHDLMVCIVENSCFHLAPESSNCLFKLCLRNNIPTIFNDAARDGHYLDPNDFVAQEVAKTLFNGLAIGDRDIGMCPLQDEFDKRSIDIRNGVMVKRSLQEAGDKRIIVQHCGRDHIYGAKIEGYSYAGSLVAQAKDHGHRTLAFYPELPYAQSDGDYPEISAWKDNQGDVVIDGLNIAEHLSPYLEDTNEKGFLSELEQAYSGAVCPFAKEKMAFRPDTLQRLNIA